MRLRWLAAGMTAATARWASENCSADVLLVLGAGLAQCLHARKRLWRGLLVLVVGTAGQEAGVVRSFSDDPQTPARRYPASAGGEPCEIAVEQCDPDGFLTAGHLP